MMLCPSCGRDNREDATFCGGCGAALAGELACASCGRSNAAGQRFCDGCGQRLPKPAPPARTPTPQPHPALPSSFAGGRYRVRRFLGEGGRKALECAIGIQRAIADWNQGVGAPHAAPDPIRVRIGLHTGEAIKEPGEFYGKKVILAARIAREAQGGEILVSSLLKELTESAGDIEFGEGREVELKGLTGKHRVFEVRWQA